MTKEQQELIFNNGRISKKQDNGGIIDYVKQYIYIPLNIENIGNGPAVSLSVHLQHLGSDTNIGKSVLTASIKSGDSIKVGIYCESFNKINSTYKEYKLDVTYQDIYKSKYNQSINIKLEWNDKNSVSATASTTQVQTLIRNVIVK